MPAAYSYERATISEVLQEKQIVQDAQNVVTTQRLRLTSRESKQTYEVTSTNSGRSPTYRLGQEVVLAIPSDPTQSPAISDVYRLPVLGGLLLTFFICVMFLVRKQGFLAFISMLISLAVVIGVLIPLLLAGYQPIIVCLGGAVLISTISMYLSHGVNWSSHTALTSIILALILASGLASLAIWLGDLSGLGSEEATFLQLDASRNISTQGLLLGGILLGALSILDDIAVAQVSIVAQLKLTKPTVTAPELFSRALSVGKDHVASLVNTLVLAYAGASLPLLILFSTSSLEPTWVVLNSQMIAEEVVRTLVGSIALVLTVPISTGLATWISQKVPLIADRHHH